MQKQKRLKKIFNELRNRFSKEKIKRIRRKFCDKEEIDKYLKKLEKINSLMEQEKHEKRHYTKKFKKVEKFLKK